MGTGETATGGSEPRGRRVSATHQPGQRRSRPAGAGRETDHQITTIQRGIDRLIDCYAGGYIEKAEFEPRIAGLKLRRSQLEEQKRATIKAANSERELSLVVSRLEDFSAKVSHGLDRLEETRLAAQPAYR